MTKIAETVRALYKSCNIGSDHSGSDYFTLIRNLVEKRKHEGEVWQRYIDQVYLLVMDELLPTWDGRGSWLHSGPPVGGEYWGRTFLSVPSLLSPPPSWNSIRCLMRSRN